MDLTAFSDERRNTASKELDLTVWPTFQLLCCSPSFLMLTGCQLAYREHLFSQAYDLMIYLSLHIVINNLAKGTQP